MRVAIPRSGAELAALLKERPGQVRLVGSGSRQEQLPLPADDALRVVVREIGAIARLDAQDQTCSVDCGVPRDELDAALARVGLELPCPGTGTLGGLFASDPIGAATHGGASPRSLLLGLEGVLADGTAFKAGARVVKSVAGFDVHKLLIGSRGRLFAATRLHLRCRPRPRAEQWFAERGLDATAAIERLRALRALALPPTALQLVRTRDGSCNVAGRIAGQPAYVSSTVRRLALGASAPCWQGRVDVPPYGEVLTGAVLPSALPSLLAALPAAAEFLWHGGGRFELAVADVATADTMLAHCTRAGIAACVMHGGPARRGIGTPLDAGQQRLTAELHRAFDPHGVFV